LTTVTVLVLENQKNTTFFLQDGINVIFCEKEPLPDKPGLEAQDGRVGEAAGIALLQLFHVCQSSYVKGSYTKKIYKHTIHVYGHRQTDK
jgi:hypothetical protein